MKKKKKFYCQTKPFFFKNKKRRKNEKKLFFDNFKLILTSQSLIWRNLIANNPQSVEISTFFYFIEFY